MQFTADVYSVSEADGEVEVCIVMRGMLEKNLTVMITALNETAIGMCNLRDSVWLGYSNINLPLS